MPVPFFPVAGIHFLLMLLHMNQTSQLLPYYNKTSIIYAKYEAKWVYG